MDLRHMRHLVAVAEELHFGRAARRLNMAQPPLSQSIKRLEDELGVRLLERSCSGVALTSAGAVFVEEAKRTLMQADLTREVTQRTARWGAHTVTVGFIGPAMFRLLPGVLAMHKTRYPDIQIKLQSLTSAEQIVGIMEGRVDVGFLHPAVDLMEGGDRMIVERCDFVAAIPADWDLARKESLTLAELAEHPLIMVPEKESPARVAALKAAFRSVGAQPNIVQEAMQTQTTLSLVANGLGASLSMETAALIGLNNIAYRRVTDLPSNLRWELAMAWYPHHTSKASQNFMDVVKDFCAENIQLEVPIVR